jgi:tetratricopeptide (TPR) repeat protein
MTVSMGTPVLLVGAAAALAGAISLQVVRDTVHPRDRQESARILYVRSGPVLQRIALEYDALLADVYWIRAIQHYGGDRLHRRAAGGNYDLLYPLLDLTTTLDPYFNIAYRFGAIFLSEGYPGGPGRPDQAVALLRKALAARPGRWQYYMDIAFVYYWHLRDYRSAAQWIQRAAQQDHAPNWLPPIAATMLIHGEDRASARFLWQQIAQSGEAWLRRSAARALLQLDALDAIDRLQPIVHRYTPPPGGSYSWRAIVERRLLPGVPLDPSGTPYALDPATGRVHVSEKSQLFPMPENMQRELQ